MYKELLETRNGARSSKDEGNRLLRFFVGLLMLGVQWELITAGGVITIIPVCIMFFFAQKRLVAGLTAGAVKG